MLQFGQKKGTINNVALQQLASGNECVRVVYRSRTSISLFMLVPLVVLMSSVSICISLYSYIRAFWGESVQKTISKRVNPPLLFLISIWNSILFLNIYKIESQNDIELQLHQDHQDQHCRNRNRGPNRHRALIYGPQIRFKSLRLQPSTLVNRAVAQCYPYAPHAHGYREGGGTCATMNLKSMTRIVCIFGILFLISSSPCSQS